MKDSSGQGSAWEVFRVFTLLGLTSFGGPVAHLGYFRDAFVVRQKWLDDDAYADLVALCQFLPGPASSQAAMAIGLTRAGYAGLIAAWIAFTLPSALLMLGLAVGLDALGVALEAGWILALKATAAAVVAHALLGMARSLAPDRERASIAAAGMVGAMFLPGTWGQITVIALGAVAGLLWLRGVDAAKAKPVHTPPLKIGGRTAALALLAFTILLAGLPIAASYAGAGLIDLFNRFYLAGALVFGGGHVVLPLLQVSVVEPGLVSNDSFLAGYGAAQALPGPLFAFAAYLGAKANTVSGAVIGGLTALVAIFLPSGLLVIGTLPFWVRLRHSATARRMLAGVNAAVVGLLAAAFYDPVFLKGITSVETMTLATAAFVALNVWQAPAWMVVVSAGIVGGVLL